MKRHLVIFGRYFRVNLIAALEYRASFVSQAFGMALSNGAFVFFWWIAFAQIGGTIGGYGFRDVMFVWAVASSAIGLSFVFFANVNQLTRLIVTGELDTFLLQPCNLLVNFACARTSLSSWGDLAYGFVLMALFLGLGTGAVFTWVAQRAPAERVGSVTGIVGAAGGLGGYFPPLVMGATYNEETHSYTIGLILLCITAVIALIFTISLARRKPAAAAATP